MKKIVIKVLTIIGIIGIVYWVASWGWLISDEIFHKLHTQNIIVEGSISVDAASCSGGALVPVDVLHTPTPYALVDRGKLTADKQPSIFNGKRVRIQGTTNENRVPVCLNGKDQRIPIIEVTDIKPI